MLACAAPGQASPAPATDQEEALTRCFTLRRSEPAAAIVVAESLLLRPLAPDFEVKVLSCLGMAAGIAGDSARAIASAERMASLLDAHPQPDDFMLRALSNAGAIFHNAGQVARAESFYQRAYAAAVSEDQAPAQVSMLINIALIHAAYLDDSAAAERYFEQALAVTLPDGQDQTLLHYNHAANLIRLGRVADAFVALDRAAASAKQAGNQLVSYRVQALRAGLLQQRGDADTARALLEQAIDAQRNLPDPAGEASSLVRLSDLQREHGQVDEALASAQAALDLTKDSSFRSERIEALAAIAAAQAALGRAGAALGAAEQAAALRRDMLKEYDRQTLASLQARLQDTASHSELERLRHEGEIAALRRDRDRLRRYALNVGLMLLVVAGGVVAVFQRRHNRRLLRLSATDPLTGLMNRRAAMERITARSPVGACEGAREVLFLIDVDRFKQINDRHGHDAGDRVLATIAARLQHACRPGDAIARWGGEEFMVMCPQLTPEQAAVVAERLRAAAAAEPFAIANGTLIELTVSVGFAPYPFFAAAAAQGDDVGGWQEAARLADRALYAAKHAGRDAWAGLWGADGARGHHLLASTLDDPLDAVRRGWVQVISRRPLNWPTPVSQTAKAAAVAA